MELKFVLPYQDTLNKTKLDLVLSYCNQLNNINLAKDDDEQEAKEKNQIYLIIDDNYNLYFLVGLSFFDSYNKKYGCLSTLLVKMDNVIFDNAIENENFPIIFKFDLKKFFSVLSFSSNYKNRRLLNLYINFDNNTIVYHISDNIHVALATRINNTKDADLKYNRIKNYFIANMQSAISNDKNKLLLHIENVDKNSFLLPYANYKDCLNFTASSVYNESYIYKNENNNYELAVLLKNENDKLLYETRAILRQDKFSFSEYFDTSIKDSVYKISPAFWQLLVILQNDKQWKTLDLYENNVTITYLSQNKDKDVSPISIKLYNPDVVSLQPNTYWKSFLVEDCYGYVESALEHVGDLTSEEIFLLNKLFSKVKDCYFDFSSQTFIGSGYIFKDDSDENIKQDYETIKLTNPNNVKSELPLKLVFSELKHYVGSDLSQKIFTISVYTDGTFVCFKKINKDGECEYTIVFDHLMSKKYLDL